MKAFFFAFAAALSFFFATMTPAAAFNGTIREFVESKGCTLVPITGTNAFQIKGGCALSPEYVGFGQRRVDPDGIADNGDEYTTTDK